MQDHGDGQNQDDVGHYQGWNQGYDSSGYNSYSGMAQDGEGNQSRGGRYNRRSADEEIPNSTIMVRSLPAHVTEQQVRVFKLHIPYITHW